MRVAGARSTGKVDLDRIHWRRELRELGRGLLDLVLPPSCPGCGADSPSLCPACTSQLRVRDLRPLAGCCTRCGAPRTPDGRCLADHRAFANLAQVVAPYWFAGTGGRLVRRLKLDADAAAGRWLARAMADAWRIRGEPPRGVLVPVPLHRTRRRRRGFDQAEWLAREVGHRLGLPVANEVLVRGRATAPQGDARVRSRAQNVRGAFAVREATWMVGARLVLVDDVFTSGATARTCAHLLRAVGVRSVSLLAACCSRPSLEQAADGEGRGGSTE